MIEIFIDVNGWNKERLKEITDILEKNGWERFGNNGHTLFFKDTTIGKARKELQSLGINEVEPEEWEENINEEEIF